MPVKSKAKCLHRGSCREEVPSRALRQSRDAKWRAFAESDRSRFGGRARLGNGRLLNEPVGRNDAVKGLTGRTCSSTWCPSRFSTQRRHLSLSLSLSSIASLHFFLSLCAFILLSLVLLFSISLNNLHPHCCCPPSPPRARTWSWTTTRGDGSFPRQAASVRWLVSDLDSSAKMADHRLLWLLACVAGASIICIDVAIRHLPGKKHFKIQDSNPFLSAGLSLSFGVMVCIPPPTRALVSAWSTVGLRLVT
jgi:hypothetical protein